MALFLLCALTGALVADDVVKATPSLSTASLVTKNINSRIYARLLLFRLALVAALESGSSSLEDGTLFYKLKLDPELAANEVAVFKRNGELLPGSQTAMLRLPTEVHKALDMSDGLRFFIQPRAGDPKRYQLFYPIAATGAPSAADWSWVLSLEMDIQKALPEILEKLRLLRSDNVLLYRGPEQMIFSFREDGIDFSASRSFRNSRSAVHEITLTDLLRSDKTGEQRLTFLKQSPPQLIDSVVSWDMNGAVLGNPWTVVHSAKAYVGEGERGNLNGEWESLGAEESQSQVAMAILTENSNFKMILERPGEVLLSEGRYLNRALTAHTVTAPEGIEVLRLSGSYAKEADQVTLRLVVKDGEKVKVAKYRFARSEKKFYKEPRKGHPQIKLRAFN